VRELRVRAATKSAEGVIDGELARVVAAWPRSTAKERAAIGEIVGR
jgi:hypothetical protein